MVSVCEMHQQKNRFIICLSVYLAALAGITPHKCVVCKGGPKEVGILANRDQSRCIKGGRWRILAGCLHPLWFG